MRILLIGNTGQVGWELERTLAPLGELVAMDFPAINLVDATATRSIVRKLQPQVIVNAAAYTNVDKAESEPELAYAINGIAPGILAEEAHSIKATLVHYSTDYVFDGEKGLPYTEDDLPNPINVYGKSKLSGEQAIQSVGGGYFILRTAWVYSLRRDSFVSKTLQWARQHEIMHVVHDQVSNPTWARMLAQVTAFVIMKVGGDNTWLTKRSGLYHLAGGGYASRLEWAQAILNWDPNRKEQIVKELKSALTSDFPTPARRPLFSALSCDRFLNTFGLDLPDWKIGLSLAMQD